MEELLKLGLRSILSLAFPGLNEKVLETVVKKLVGILIGINDPVRRDAEITVAMAELKAALPNPIDAVTHDIPLSIPPAGGLVIALPKPKKPSKSKSTQGGIK
jgi:hypothetical protein